MIKTIKYIAVILTFVSMVLLCACDILSAGTKMQFSFSTSTPANSIDKRIIYVDKDAKNIKLNCALQVDSGNVTIEIVSLLDNELIWSNSYSKGDNFVMELAELKADSEYLLKITALQSKQVKLTITSKDSLIKEKEAPDKAE